MGFSSDFQTFPAGVGEWVGGLVGDWVGGWVGVENEINAISAFN